MAASAPAHAPAVSRDNAPGAGHHGPSAHEAAHAGSHAAKPTAFEVRVLRQDAPGEPSRWERHRVTYEPNLNVISVLQKIAAQATTVDGEPTTPVAWDCNCLEEVCGACTMLVNGVTRQACSALVDRLLEDNADGIELRPMSKFPVLRDLCVDRRRMFRCSSGSRAGSRLTTISTAARGRKSRPRARNGGTRCRSA